MDLTTEKVVVLSGMLVVTLCFGMLPVKLVFWAREFAGFRRTPFIADLERQRAHCRKIRWRRRISYANCFSGGVFMAACLLDLFPDVREAIDHVLDELESVYHTKVDYPVAEFIIVFGFLVVMSLEQIVLDCKERWSPREAGRRRQRRAEDRGPIEPQEEHQPQHQGDRGGHLRSITAEAADAVDGQSATILVNSSRGGDDDDHDPLPQPGQVRYFRGVDNGGVDHENEDNEVSGDPDDQADLDESSSFLDDHSYLRSLMLLVALTFHSLFEGLAIGLQTEAMQLIQLFLAVVVHKAVMAFSLGLNLAQSHGITVKSFVASVLAFSVASPLGMGLGMVLVGMEKSLARDAANGVLQGVAGGTFLYITFFEVLPHEFSTPHHRLPKLLFVLAGISVVCAILFIHHG